MSVPFIKPALSIDAQIAQLISRGLEISDVVKATKYLGNINYYRLSAYWFTFLEDPKNQHIFKKGTTFESIIDTYVFDRRLRILIFDEIERIEISFRTRMIQEYCMRHGKNWYEDPAHYRKPEYCQSFLEILNKEVAGSKEDFMRHYRTKYDQASPPCWIAFQLISFGQASILFKNLRSCEAKKEIAKYYGLDEQILASWLDTISFVRNACAHHSRLWNRHLPRVPQLPRVIHHPWLNSLPGPNFENRVYLAMAIVRFLLARIIPTTSFTQQTIDLFARYPKIPKQRMGFTPGWEKEPLWVN